jgi:tetratricopeptide (TPR) repeat protein
MFMNKTIHITDSKTTTAAGELPLGQLFYLLYANGFSVKPDDYIELLKITERFGSHDIDETAKWICPIIATNETEQTRFYNIIEQYKKLSGAASAGSSNQNKSPWLTRRSTIAIALAAIALLIWFIWASLPKETYPLQESNRQRVIKKGDSLLLDAAALLRVPADTEKVRVQWEFEDGSKKNGSRVAHIFTTPGKTLVKRQFSSAHYALPTTADTLQVTVCNDIPNIILNVPAQPIAVGQPVTVSATVNALPGTVSFYQWNINDSIFTTDQPAVSGLVFLKEGEIAVQCKAVVDSVLSPCTATDNKTITVFDNGLHYNAIFSAAHPGSYSVKERLQWWVNLLLLLPAAAALLYSIFKRRKKPSKKPPQRPPVETLNKGPAEIPFEQNDLRFIQQDKELRRTLVQMRYRAEEETLALSVPATINAIIQSGGSPSLVYAPLTQQQRYLVLIDGANPKSMLTRLFTWLVKSIAEDGIPATVFYYNKKLACYNDAFPGGISLQRLAEIYSNDTLIIIGKAWELVYSAYPVIEEKILQELNRWQNKAIITPVPVQDWSVREKILQQYLVLLPADTSSLQKLVPALREKIKPNTSLLSMEAREQYSVLQTDFNDITALKEYLDNDEALFQWLCSICIYPRLKWEIVVEIGKIILEKYGQPAQLNYTSLLKLCRISWMQQGVFPQATRLELLKELTVENEVLARERLLKMLEYSTSVFGEKGYLFEEEKRRQRLTNQFILHANDQERFAVFKDSHDAFKKIWANDRILDMPLKKYLDKSGEENWTTPVNNGQRSVGLATYFSQQEISLQKSLRLRRIAAAAVAVLLTASWAYLVYGGGAGRIAPFITVHEETGQDIIPININVIKRFAACGDTAENRFAQLDGYLDFGEEKIPLDWDVQTGNAIFNTPFKYLQSGKASIMLSWDINKSVKLPLVFTNTKLPDTVTISCLSQSFVKQPLYIRYNDTSGYNMIAKTVNDALFQYNLSALQSDFSDSSRIIYYEPNQRARADSIVAIVQQSLGIKVTTEFIREERTPPATPILFLNTALRDTVAADDPEEKKANARDHHLMGDQYYEDKKYREALDEYAQAISLNPADALAYYNRGLCYEALGNSFNDNPKRILNLPLLENALKEYNAAISLNEKDAQSWYRKASIKYSQKRYSDAIPDYTRVIAINSPEMKRQNALCVYFRGRCYYYLKDFPRACDDFKRSGALGVEAGKTDYAANCGNNDNKDATVADCSKTFYSVKEALSVNPAVICKIDLSRQSMNTIPKELYGFKNCKRINLGSNAIPQNEIDRLQKTLPGCTILFSRPQPATTTAFGFIELDNKGYTDAAGQDIMQKVSRLLKAQPSGKIILRGTYTDAADQKQLKSYMNTIVNMFAKIGVNTKMQVEQQVAREPVVQQQVQQNAPYKENKKMRIQVTGINLTDDSRSTKKA